MRIERIINKNAEHKPDLCFRYVLRPCPHRVFVPRRDEFPFVSFLGNTFALQIVPPSFTNVELGYRVS